MKRKILIIFFCFIFSTASAELNLISTIKGGYWKSFDLDIDKNAWGFRQTLLNHLFMCDKNELQFIRNAIYARHGYIFNSTDLRNYFNQFDWYNATKTNVDSELTENEKHFILLIQKIEMNYPRSVNDNIFGYWADADLLTPMGEGYWWNYIIEQKQFRIYPNGTFYYQDDRTFRESLYTGVYGLWSWTNNEFRITELSDNIEVFGDIHTIINKINKNIMFNEYIHEYDKTSYIKCNLINDSTIWVKHSNDPKGEAK
jgi:hypothetical protein